MVVFTHLLEKVWTFPTRAGLLTHHRTLYCMKSSISSLDVPTRISVLFRVFDVPILIFNLRTTGGGGIGVGCCGLAFVRIQTETRFR